jgi:hypothetical protein
MKISGAAAVVTGEASGLGNAIRTASLRKDGTIIASIASVRTRA